MKRKSKVIKNRNVLIVDDDLEILQMTRKCLEWDSYSVKVATTGSAALKSIQKEIPDLVLLDLQIPDINGLEILKLLRKSKKYVSVIFLSSHSKVDDVIKGLDSGADDYVCKPFNVQELLARIRSQFRIKGLKDKLERANRKLRELAHTDDLTGLSNMRSIYDKLNLEIKRAKRYKRSVWVFMLDIDYFKAVNDENDHLFGSFVLSQVGEILRENIREVDFAARYGGDEFLIVLTEVNQKKALVIAERLRNLIGRKTFSYEGFSVKLTVSIGASYYNYKHKKVDAKDLVRLSDHALYEAKQTGRNRIRIKYPLKKKVSSLKTKVSKSS